MQSVFILNDAIMFSRTIHYGFSTIYFFISLSNTLVLRGHLRSLWVRTLPFVSIFVFDLFFSPVMNGRQGAKKFWYTSMTFFVLFLNYLIYINDI